MRDTSYPHGAHGLKERTRDKVNLMDGELLWEDGIQAPRNKKRFFYIREKDGLHGQKVRENEKELSG